ncbi:stage II sporulation protein P [Ureibacillus sp. FSL K6-8385]|uniref:Stage II sporulation protein P n=1 Tax=Ureibacillus terrenus TaxID=118246 RepID=A0A540V4Y0_9BACL|nr:stage II sporulation protein P [Ureibacillus terrenus]MED3661508.1 stage II sporulation protein P [Ureibacillus terrenus]MED3763975.1 stage II sporulation protein P [Ureibacillus terrenus]TQE91804.1 stage II sporulation protein P [Ureibacillus terrenus]
MVRKIKGLVFTLLFFFSLPIVIGLLPFPNNEKFVPAAPEEKILFASNDLVVSDVAPPADAYKVLLVFTHSHETYKPLLENEKGMVAVYDSKTNLFSMHKLFEDYFRLNGISAKTLQVDVMDVMKQKGKGFHEAYKTARPYIAEELKNNHYDLILDIHRDSTSRNKTTVVHKDVSYAKASFVIGAENPNYKHNKAVAQSISNAMNQIIPNISKGIIEKKGTGVDGVYNQDLAKEFVLIEIGGIDNTEDEVYRTAAVLAQAVANGLARK